MIRERLRRWLDRLGFVGLSGGVFAWGLVRGVQVVTIRLDLVVIGLFVLVDPRAVLSGVLFAAFMLASGVLFVTRLVRGGRHPSSPSTPGDEPVTAVVPVYRDADVLRRSIESLRGATHPVDVLVV